MTNEQNKLKEKHGSYVIRNVLSEKSEKSKFGRRFDCTTLVDYVFDGNSNINSFFTKLSFSKTF